MPIHPTAVIDSKAELDSTVEVGPYVTIEGPVRIEARTKLFSMVALAGPTHIGPDCQIYPHASIGFDPQDRAYDPATVTHCSIGARTIIREGVTIHRGTQAGSSTIVGDDCFLMANSHVAHNCRLDNNVVLVNGVLLAGHVEIGARAFVGGAAVVHQFARIGELAMIGGLGQVAMDVPPFFMLGHDHLCVGVNVVGMRRAGLSRDERQEVRECYRILYRSGLTFRAAVDRVEESIRTPVGRRLLEFLRSPSKRGFTGGSRSEVVEQA